MCLINPIGHAFLCLDNIVQFFFVYGFFLSNLQPCHVLAKRAGLLSNGLFKNILINHPNSSGFAKSGRSFLSLFFKCVLCHAS
ncbi:MAG: hypothetical protein DWH74_00125 [Planctomycetota bacterium]|nr:MAG: hypothetical protein DWH74_00125 [Planctomycetota bacterium]